MHRHFKSIVAVLVLLSLITMLLAGCQQTAAPAAPTTAKEDTTGPIKLGLLTDLTGPIATSALPQFQAGQIYIDYLNKNGGVQGHPFEIVAIDTKYDNNLAVAGFEKLASQGDITLISSVTANFMSVCKPLAERYKIPLYGPTEYGSILPFKDNPYIFGGGPAYADYYRSGFFWIRDTWKKADPPRFALMGLDVAFSKSCMKGVKWMLESEFKYPIVAEEWMSLGSTNATSQVTNIKNAKPDYVVLCSTGVPQIVFLKTAYAMGLSDNTIILDTFLSAAPTFRAADKKAMTGIINFLAVSIYPQMIEDAPIMITLEKLFKEEMTGVYFDWTRISAMGSMVATAEIFDKAVTKYGYKNLSGEIMKKTMEEDMTGNTTKGLFAPNENSPTNHVTGHNCNIVRTTETYDLELVQKWYKMPPWPSIAGDPGFWR